MIDDEPQSYDDRPELVEARRVAASGGRGASGPVTIACQSCGGTGIVYEQHDYASEELGCQDCQGTGRVTL